jgi:hypothetical protein
VINNITVLDNFYDNPESVVSLLNGDYPIMGCGTGKRSIGLEQINHQLYNAFCDAIFKIHGISSNGLHVTTFFMEHEYDAIEIFNQRWVHIDGKNPDICLMSMQEYKLVLCGQIYLTKDPDPEAGTKICNLKSNVNWSEKELVDNCINFYTRPKEKYMAGLIDLDQYTKEHQQYHSNFELTCDVKNVYNRMVSWKAGTLHGDPVTSKMKSRLNQYFFVETI